MDEYVNSNSEDSELENENQEKADLNPKENYHDNLNDNFQKMGC